MTLTAATENSLGRELLLTLTRDHGITLVIVTHDPPELAARCDRQLFIRDRRAVRSLDTPGEEA